MKTTVTLLRWLSCVGLFLMTLAPFSASEPLIAPPLMAPAVIALPALAPPVMAPPASDCLPIDPPPPVVKIKVRVVACSEPGQAIEYRMCIENCSTMEAHHVIVKNALPTNAKFVRADPEPTKHGAELHWNLGTVGGGARREITLWLLPTDKEDVKNCARVQFEHGICVVTRQSAHAGDFPFDPSRPGFDPTRPRPPIIKEVPVEPKKEPKKEDMPVLDISIRGPKEQYVNLPSRYEITVTNKGKTKATNAAVHCTAATKLKIVKASEPGVTVENVVAWKLNDLEPGASKVVELTLRAAEKGEYCLKATAEADLGLKKETEFCTNFVGVSVLSVEMFDRTDPVFVGDKTSFPITIRSQGSAAVTGVKLKAFVPDGLKLESTKPMVDKQDPVKGGRWLEFRALPKIDTGEQARYEIFVEATLAGRTRFHIEVLADQLDSGRPVVWEELTTIVDDRK